MKVDRVDVACRHGRYIKGLARCVRAGEIQSDMIAHHETDNRQRNIFDRSNTDAHHDTGRRFQNVERLSGSIKNRDADHLCPGIAEAVIYIRDRVYDLGRLDGLMGSLLDFTVRGGQVDIVFLDHCGHISSDDGIRVSDFFDAAGIEPHGAVS